MTTTTPATTSSRSTTVIQVVLILIGLAALARGAYYVLTIVTPSQLIPTAIWLAAGIVVHDGFIAPISLVLGRAVHPGAALRFAWLGAGTVALLSIPLIQGAKNRRNATVIPDDPWTNLWISLGLVVLGALIAFAAHRYRSHRRRPHPDAPVT